LLSKIINRICRIAFGGRIDKIKLKRILFSRRSQRKKLIGFHFSKKIHLFYPAAEGDPAYPVNYS
jgi:hypothetical protein